MSINALSGNRKYRLPNGEHVPRGGKAIKINYENVLPLDPLLYNEKLPRTLTRPRHSARINIEKFDVPMRKLFDINANKMDVADGCWIGKRLDKQGVGKSWTVNMCKDAGFEGISWNGRTPLGIIDSSQRLFGVGAGRPQNADWDNVVRHVNHLMRNMVIEGQVSHAFDGLDTRRGDFHGIPAGVSFGGGQPYPRTICQKPAALERIVNTLTQDAGVRRIAGFQSHAFAWFAPKVYRHYYQNLEELYNHETGSDLNPIFGNRSIYPAATFNIGPLTATAEHLDFKNVPYGWCSITALGNFDHRKGGHLILFDLKKYIEFPAGSTILIPSALLRHGNTPIEQTGADICRMSLTQYCAGGLFRWKHYGFQTMASLESDPKGRAFKASRQRDTREVQDELANLFSTINSIQADREMLFGHD